MRYPFECQECEKRVDLESRPFHPPAAPTCCGQPMWRVYGCLIDTSGCKDHDDIPEEKRVQRPSRPRSTVAEEAKFRRHIEERRKLYASEGQTPGLRHTHSIPADLYHGKIKQTGDKDYWQDPKNLNRHRTTKVS